MLKSFILSLGAALSLSACTTAQIAPAPAVAAGSSAETPATTAVRGMVSTAHPRASEAGAAILRQGGSATDAAIAVMLALTVVEPQSSGIGGGGFYLRTNAAGEVVSLDGRETAPAGATPQWFLDADGERLGFSEAVISGLSVGVPGNLALAAEAHARYGKLEWSALFAPAIALAQGGFEVTERTREFLTFAKARGAHTAEGRALFYSEDGEPLPAGTLVRNPALAESFAAMAQAGPQWLYQGAVAEELAALIRTETPRQGGMVPDDLGRYTAVWRDPVCGTYRAHKICGMGPPSSGATTLFAMLKQLEAHDLAALGPQSATAWHLFAESQRLAYADRELYLADADFVPVPVDGLMDADYLRARGALIAADRRMDEVAAGKPPGAEALLAGGEEAPDSGTSHFVVSDSDGNVVTYTSTIEGPFGSGLMFGGFFLNNELTDFSFVPEVDGRPVANRVEGGKRPRSSMAPTLVFGPDGKLRVAIGAAGGSTIPIQVAKSLIGVIDWGLTVEEAIALPNMFAPGDTASLEEVEMLLALRPQLEALGHEIGTRRAFGKVNAVEWRGGRWVGAADPRSEGIAIGE